MSVWGEFVNPKELQQIVDNLVTEVATLRLEVDELKRKQDEMGLLNAAPIGTYVPRNRRIW